MCVVYNKERLLEKIKELLKEGVKLGINITELETKINNVEQMMNGGKVSIALMGSISDGKTTTVAALLGQLFEDMKIDEDESSDELKVYHPVDMDDRFEIIDTPGLWGTSEKECENKIVRLSEITLRYLS